MRRSVSTCVIGAACVLTLAVPALAQQSATPQGTPAAAPAQAAQAVKKRSGDIEGGIALFNRVTNKGEDETYAPGWHVGGSYQITPMISMVGLLTADYHGTDGRTANLYTYAGGPRFQWKRANRVRPFFEVLFGGGQDNGIFAPSRDTNYYPMLAPSVGTDVALSKRAVVRVRFDVPLLMKFSDTYVGTRVAVGLSVPLGGQ